jgi:putative ATP-dependent endonuclease of OLD family
MHLKRISVEGLRASADYPISVDVPGRFSIFIGANSAGKTTVCDAAYMAHAERFPQLPPFSAAALGGGPRSVEVEYAFEDDVSAEGPLGRQLWNQAGVATPSAVAGAWNRTLTRSLGTIRPRTVVQPEFASQVRFIYLPA